MVVIVLLGGTKRRARDTRVVSDLKSICRVLDYYYVYNGEYPYVGCSYTGQLSSQHYGIYRDNPHTDHNNIFDVLQPYLVPDYMKQVPNDPDAVDPNADWSYFYDNYYDSVRPDYTPETSSCTNQAFQLLGYIESTSDLTWPYELPWGTWEGQGWYRACKRY